MTRFLIAFILIFSMNAAFATTLSQMDDSEEDSVVETSFRPRRQIATIVYMGLAGAVLGLSTLSFYGRPQDRLTNIAVGFGVGVMVGAVYMTYKAATDPAKEYRSEYEMEEARRQTEEHWYMGQVAPQPMTWSYTWSF